MKNLELTAVSREKLGKSEARRFRVKGLVPGILYGKGMKPVSLAVPMKELEKTVSSSAGMNAIINLHLQQATNKETVVVMLRDYQADSISRNFTHADFVKVDMKATMKVMVPIHVTGKAIGFQKGGLLEHGRREIEVECLPTAIPNQIDVDITALDMGDVLHIDDLKMPEGVKAVRETNFTIVSIVAPAAEEAPVVAEVAADAVPSAADAKAAEKEGGKADDAGAAPADKKAEKKGSEKKS